MADDIIWEPSGYYSSESNIRQFMDAYGYSEYRDLVPETESDVAEIWGEFADDTGIVWEEAFDNVLDTSDGVEFAQWYSGGRLNAVDTILDQWVARSPERPMYVWEDEAGNSATVTYSAMARRVNRLANALRDLGVSIGDVVGITFPFHPNAFVASLACLRIGATITQVFPGYGAEAMGHRFNDSSAEVVITADGYRRGGNASDLATKVDEALVHAPTVTDVILDDHLGNGQSMSRARVHKWGEFVAGYDDEVESTVVDSDHPALIAYSSGTTGTPKGTIHTHASLLAMGNKEAKYHFDCTPGDTLTWITDFGWIIVPIWMLAGAPALGTSVLLLEGGPMSPNEDRLWQAVENYEVTILGMAPTVARQLREVNSDPGTEFDLSSLRILGSTGEPWDESGWKWYFEAVGSGHTPIINGSGGTELAGAILSPTPVTPLKPRTLAGPAPGVATNIYDATGTPVDEGYLVVDYPIPGMTHSLTDGDDRYLSEYWSDFNGVWNQNDLAKRDEDGFWFITGRADDTMNVAGRRVTSQELEEAIVEHQAVEESAIISTSHETRGEVPIAFVTVDDKDTVGADLVDDLRECVAEQVGPPFRPSAVHIVTALPRTQTGKVPREVLSRVYHGQPVDDPSTLERADVLSDFERER